MRSLVGTLMRMGACAPAILWVLKYPDARTALAAISLRNDTHLDWMHWLVWELASWAERDALRRLADTVPRWRLRARARARFFTHDQIVARLRANGVTEHPTRHDIARYVSRRAYVPSIRRAASRMFPEFAELFQ